MKTTKLFSGCKSEILICSHRDCDSVHKSYKHSKQTNCHKFQVKLSFLNFIFRMQLQLYTLRKLPQIRNCINVDTLALYYQEKTPCECKRCCHYNYKVIRTVSKTKHWPHRANFYFRLNLDYNFMNIKHLYVFYTYK